VLIDGRIVFNNRGSTIDCTVRDLSETGARISFPEAHQIPPEVELEIPKTGQWFRAKVVRSFGHSHGLRFINDTPPEPHLSDKPPRIEGTAAVSLDIQKVLSEARNQIAQLAGVSPDAVRLKLEIDY
jgi:hypothetical protein